jgi:CRP/FNR family transcriptional regulator
VKSSLSFEEFEGVPVPAAMPENVRREFADRCTAVSLRQGTFIRMEGQRCDTLAIIVSGLARVYKSGDSGREITLYRIHPGESCIITASCILSDHAFPATAVVERDIDALVVDSVTFRDWIKRHDYWRHHVFELLATRLAHVLEVVQSVTFRRMDQRVAGLIDASVSIASNSLSRTHAALADELGTSREVVSRILKDFERSGLVQLGRAEIQVLDRAGLRRKAQGK